MKKMVLAAAASTMVLAGCTTAEQTAVGGAAIGAGVGAIATGTLEGAAIGSLVGAVGGYLVGRAADGRCQYRDRTTNTLYYAQCPRRIY